MKISTKLFVLTGAFAASLLAFWGFSTRTSAITRIGSPLYDEIIVGKDLLADVLPPPAYIIESYLTLHEMADQGDPAALVQSEAKLTRLKQEFDARIDHWTQSLSEGPMKASLVNEATPPAHEFFQIAEAKVLPLIREGKNDEARALIASEIESAFVRHQQAIGTVVERATEFAKANEEAAQSSVAFWTRVQIGSAFIIGAVMATVGLIIGRSITKPINTIISVLRDIAEGEGDLTKRLNINTDDEPGELSRWFDRFVERLHGTISKVSLSSTSVADSAERIAAASEQAASNTRSQTSQSEFISRAIEEMTTATSDIARKSSEAASIASEATQRAKQGGDVVRGTVEGIKSISILVKDSSAVIGQLNERSEEIGKIAEVINDIADQTNLLALNAAIEAARAGEHGRGFAVVADEVRKLADRTAKATSEIASSIKTIQTETTTVVERFSNTSAKMDQAVQLAEQSGQVLDQICNGTHQVASMIESIAAATEEQSSSAGSVRDGVSQISVTTSETAQGADEAAKAATMLHEQSRVLTALVSGFKLELPPADRGVTLAALGVRQR